MMLVESVRDLVFFFFFTRAKFLENKIYTEKTRKLRQNTQKIANFLHYYGKIHSKLPIFGVKSVQIYTGQFFLHRHRLWCLWQIKGMCTTCTSDDMIHKYAERFFHSLDMCVPSIVHFEGRQ